MRNNVLITLGVLLIFCQVIFADNSNETKIAYSQLQNSESLPNAKDDTDVKSVENSLTDLSELTFQELLSNFNVDKDEKYKGDFYPVRVFPVPGKLRKNGLHNHKMVMMNTNKSSERLFILFPVEKGGEISEYIRYHKQMSIVYQRVGIFHSKYPLLKFIQNISSE